VKTNSVTRVAVANFSVVVRLKHRPSDHPGFGPTDIVDANRLLVKLVLMDAQAVWRLKR